MVMVIWRADGGVSIMYPVGERCPDVEIAKWRESHPDEYVSHAVVEDEEMPQDRAFRNAWTHDGKAFGVDMEKARSILVDQIRVLRQPLLAALDVEYQRADEKADASAKADVVARKQALRDATQDPAIAAAATPEALLEIYEGFIQ